MRISKKQRKGFTLIEVIVCISMISVLTALLLPAVMAAREAARRSQCMVNLRQLGIALHAYHEAHETFPSGSTSEKSPISNTPAGHHFSWIVRILPYLEQEALYDQFNFRLSVYDPIHQTARGARISVLLCPSDSSTAPFGTPMNTNYAGCYHHFEKPLDSTGSGILIVNEVFSMEQLPEGSSNTAIVAEVPYDTPNLGWASGTRSTLRNGGLQAPINIMMTRMNSPLYMGGFGSRHPGGLQSLYADGSVRFQRSTTGFLGILGVRDRLLIEENNATQGSDY